MILLLGAPCMAQDNPPPAAASDAPVVRQFVDVPYTDAEDIRTLARQNFDIAGVDRESGYIGIVATDEELNRLSELGYTYYWRESSHPLRPPGPKVLADYTDPTEMSAFMDQVQAAYPNIAKKVLIKDGLFESHKIYAMKITKDVDQPNERPMFFLDAQHHAREVMTAEIARDMMDYLTSRYATDTQVQTWVDSIEIWIVPIVDPDGAAYVFSPDSNWRKHRRPSCPVDVNRNYDFNWNACAGSTGVCTDDTNRGTAPDSEPETQGMVQSFSDLRPLFALSYHSYGQYLMYSYGCLDPDEKTVMNGLGTALNSILQNDNGTTGGFAMGPVWSTIYTADGGSLDTQYGRYGTYSYVIEVNSSSFQPDYATWRNITVQRQRTAWQFFLDKTLNAPQIRGKITNASTGAPLAATVSLQEVAYTHGEYPRKADARGLYHWLTAASTTYHLTASMPGYCSQTRTVAVGTGPATLNIALSVPTAPSSLQAHGDGDNRIAVSWSAVSGATEYHILRSLASGGSYTQIGTVSAPLTTYADTSVSGHVTYYYVVRALTDCESANSTEASTSTTGNCILAPGFAGAASVANPAGATCVLTVSWITATPYCGGPLTYRVYRSTSSSFTPSSSTLIASGLNGTSFTDHAALASGTNYYYIVRSVDASSGAEDGNTAILSGAPSGPYSPGTWSDDAGDTGTAKMVLASPWSVLSTGGKTAPKVYATGTTTSNLCAALTTPALTLSTSAVLTFQSKYDLETNYDAGIVEIATSPDFSTWTKVSTVNYPNPLTYTGNACGFAASGTGTVFSKTYTTPAYSASAYTASLSAYNGSTVKLRWRVSTDSATNGKGWWIDDLKITNVMMPGTCSAGTASPPKEASPTGLPMTGARASGTAIQVAYTSACGSLDSAIYWGTGPIISTLHWTNAVCALGNTGLTVFDPGTPAPGHFIYFVVVGQTTTKEGSYGKNSAGVERPEAVGIGACDKPLDTSSTSCP